jgi:hypothetical protein
MIILAAMLLLSGTAQAAPIDQGAIYNQGDVTAFAIIMLIWNSRAAEDKISKRENEPCVYDIIRPSTNTTLRTIDFNKLTTRIEAFPQYSHLVPGSILNVNIIAWGKPGVVCSPNGDLTHKEGFCVDRITMTMGRGEAQRFLALVAELQAHVCMPAY